MAISKVILANSRSCCSMCCPQKQSLESRCIMHFWCKANLVSCLFGSFLIAFLCCCYELKNIKSLEHYCPMSETSKLRTKFLPSYLWQNLALSFNLPFAMVCYYFIFGRSIYEKLHEFTLKGRMRKLVCVTSIRNRYFYMSCSIGVIWQKIRGPR